MRGKVRAALAAGTVALVLGAAGVARAATPVQPGQPTTGYGSKQGYISASATKYVTGDGYAGTRVWWYVPATLKNGTSAPVVIFLHGFELLAPEIYQGHIDHLTKQGFIVIYPQFNKGGISGLLSDTDQNQMIKRAIDATNVALGKLGAKADRTDMHLFGHSLGGLMGGSWVGKGGPAVRSLTLANPSLNPSGAIPSFVAGLITITPIDHATAAKSNNVRTIILTGDQDTIAAPSESVQYATEMTNAPSKVVYQATSDSHGSPAIKADHMAAIQDDGFLPSFLMDLFGGTGEQDSLDYRVYYAALDANVSGATSVPWSMGTWTDGVPVKPPTQLTP